MTINTIVKTPFSLKQYLKDLVGLPEKQYKLVLFNDDKNSGHWVCEKLTKHLGVSSSDAFTMVMKAHHDGSSVIYTGTKTECRELYSAIRSEGADTRYFSTAEKLKLTVSKV